jgi:hypothetical protein
MNKHNFLPAALLVVAAVLLVVLPAYAKAEKTEFSGSWSLETYINPGVCTYPDGNVHCRGVILQAEIDVSDPRVSGVETVVANYNLQPGPLGFYTGPMWGTSRIENEGGYWDTVWTAFQDEQGFLYIQAVAHGHGDYDGLKMHASLASVSPDPEIPLAVSGYVLEPGMK